MNSNLNYFLYFSLLSPKIYVYSVVSFCLVKFSLFSHPLPPGLRDAQHALYPKLKKTIKKQKRPQFRYLYAKKVLIYGS